MAKKPKRLPRDVNARAHAIIEIATGETEVPAESAKATSGRKGGAKGGNARATKLSATERSRIAKKAAGVRWAEHCDDSESPDGNGDGKDGT
jgi:hypothetical protein